MTSTLAEAVARLHARGTSIEELCLLTSMTKRELRALLGLAENKSERDARKPERRIVYQRMSRKHDRRADAAPIEPVGDDYMRRARIEAENGSRDLIRAIRLHHPERAG